MGLFERIFTDNRREQCALLFERREITYGELRDETFRVREVLRALNLKPGDRVALILADSPEFIASFVAVISLGGIAAPINLALRREEQLFILKDCGASAAMVEGSIADAWWEGFVVPGDLSNVILVQRGAVARAPELAGIRVQLYETAARTPANDSPPEGRADTDDAFILYTSGSTGEPKGAVHTQADVFYTNETFCREVLKLRDGDRLFSSSRLPFAYGLGNAFTFPLLNGFTTILCKEKPSPAVISQVFQDYRPTIFFGVPVVYRMLLDHHREVARLDTSSVRLCISAGEALPAHLGQEWEDTFGVQVLDGIGSTEMLHMFMSNHDGDLRYGSSGRLLQGYEARLIDHEGVATPLGEAGNLWIRGASAASRYWNRAESSLQTFVDGWVRTGDLYRSDEQGFWWHMGRSDDCFKSSGQWVSPVEVEGVLIRSDSIRAAAVVAGRDADGLACVCAFVVMTDGHTPEAGENDLRGLCETALPRFKRPRRYIFMKELPYTATGKVQRFKLRDQLRAEPSASERGVG
jgi:benzoate-CoA ligase family protein